MKAIRVFDVDPITQKLILTSNIGSVTGTDLLLQKIAKFLLTKPGSNLVDSNYGTLLGDKGYLARMGANMSSVKLLIVHAVDTANTYFSGAPTDSSLQGNFDHMELNNVYVSADDPTVFYAEIFVYLTDGGIYNLTV